MYTHYITAHAQCKTTWWLVVCTNWDRSCGWFPGCKKHLGTRLATRLTSAVMPVWRRNQRKDMMRYVEYYMLKCIILADQKHWSWIVTCTIPPEMPEKVASLICDGSQSQVKYFLTPHSLERPDLDERVDSNSLGRILYEDAQGWWWCGCHNKGWSHTRRM